MEDLRSAGSLILAEDQKEEMMTAGGIVIPEHDRSSLPLRAKVIAVPYKLLQAGLLPGDTVLYTAQTREKICVQFKPRVESKEMVAIPPECVIAYVPAAAETRAKSVARLRETYTEEMASLIESLGHVEDVHVRNEWKM